VRRDTIRGVETGTVADLTIQPTAKFLKAGAIAAGIVFLALEIACLVSLNAAAGTALIMLIPLLVPVWPALRYLRRHFTRTVISGDRLRSETGIATRSTRNIQLSKVQDVRVDQRLIERLFNIGDLSIETAGETSRLMILNVDNPQALADEIMNRAQRTAPAA
jgi:membrane protein YdbS with pleckstrin-like domain